MNVQSSTMLGALARNIKAAGKIWTRERPQALPFLYSPMSPRRVGAEFYAALGRELVRDRDDAWIIVCPYSLGDTYLLASLGEAFRRAHCADGKPVVLVVKSSLFPLALMFRQHFDRIIGLEDLYLNAIRLELEHVKLSTILCPGHAYFPHPNHLHDARADLTPTFGRVSQLGMYATLLRLPLETRPALPQISPDARQGAAELAAKLGIRDGRSVLLFPESNSWEQVPDEFWQHLAPRLQAAGWDVYTNASGSWRGPRAQEIEGARLIHVPLDLVYPFLERAGWAIGTLCGMMNSLVTARLACRKTILTRGVAPGADDDFFHPAGLLYTYPYAYQRTFDGLNYDIEEYQVLGPETYERVAATIARGFNAQSPSPPAPDPVLRIPADLMPGELFDKVSILEIKRDRLPDSKRVQAEKELTVLYEISRPLCDEHPELRARYAELKRLNELGWDLNEHIFKQFDDTDYGTDGWQLDVADPAQVQAVERSVREFRHSQQTNRDRVRLKNEINAICRAAWAEEKSFDIGALRA